MKNKILYFTVGCSGSGKTTYYNKKFLSDFPEVQEVIDKNQITLQDLIVCPDDLRRELLGNVNDQSRANYVFGEAKSRVNQKLNDYGVAIFDATTVSNTGLKFVYNINSDERIMLVFRPDVDLSWERIKNQINNGEDRSRVPFNIIEKQYRNFKLQIIGDEKWDGVWNQEVKEKIIKKHDLPFRNQKFYFID